MQQKIPKKASFLKNILPREKGVYGVLGEPILLGLLTFFSGTGCSIALMAIASLFLRESLFKAMRKPHLRRGMLWMSLGCFVSIGALFSFVLLRAQNTLWVFLLLIFMVPFFQIQVWADHKGLNRKLWVELLGVVAPGGVASAISLSGGASPAFAMLLWLLCLARSLPTFLYVRYRVKKYHHEEPGAWPVYLSHYIALLVVFLLVSRGSLPEITLGIYAFFLLRSIVGLWGRGEKFTAKRLGYAELAYGLVATSLLGLGL